MSICAQIAKSSFLIAVVVGMNLHTMKDTLYRISASTVTMRRFGPSGSWKRKNNVLEHTSAVIPRSSNDVFFAVKGIVVEWRYFTMTSTLFQLIFRVPCRHS